MSLVLSFFPRLMAEIIWTAPVLAHVACWTIYVVAATPWQLRPHILLVLDTIVVVNAGVQEMVEH